MSVQVSYHPDWHATVKGQRRELWRDGLGPMWLRPGRNGPIDVELDYDGGWELRFCRWLSWLALAGVVAVALKCRTTAPCRSRLRLAGYT